MASARRTLVLALALVASLVPIVGAAPALAAPPVLVVNEIMNNPSAVSDSAGEWFEVYNPGSADVDIDGFTIRDDGSDLHVIANGGPLLVPAGGFVVLGNNADSTSNGGVTVDYSYGSDWFLSNSGDEVIIEDTLSAEVDRVEYDGGPLFPDPTGASMALFAPVLDNNVGANWCESPNPFGAGDLGTPGAENDCAVELVVNEIMNNPSAVSDSAGEWFEVYNPGSAAVDINGFTIRDDGSDSHVITNGGPLLVPAGGFVVLGNNANSATNGGVTVDYQYSGIALANGDDEVIIEDTLSAEVDRVEYDGGPLFPDPTGASMALFAPVLDNNVGANWCESPNPFGAGDLGTPGAENDCAVEAVVLVVNEIMNNPSAVSDSAGEWFEVYNPGSADVDIDGFTIRDDGSDLHVIANGGPLLVPAGGFVVLGNNADSTSNGGVTVDYSYGSDWFLSNSGDEVIIEDTLSAEVDRVEYDGGPLFPDPTGASMALFAPVLDNNVGANWCESPNPFGAGDLGTPGAENDCAVELVVNEIMNNPSAVSDSAGEWFEVYNPGSAAVDINGFTIRDDGSDSHVITNGGPLLVPAGGFVVLGNNADSASNGGVTVDYQYSGIALANGDDEVIIEDTLSAEVDRVEYDGGPLFPDPTGASMALFDPALDNNVGANWCESPNPFGTGDLGTPGGVNDCFVVPPGPDFGVCYDNMETLISVIQGPGFSSPVVGEIHVIEGVVVGDFQESDELSGFFVQEEDADAVGGPSTSEGLFTFDNSFGTDVALGQVVRVRGTVVENFGQTQLNSVTDVAICGADTATPATVILPIAGFEAYESVEGMGVSFDQELFVSDNFNWGRFGELLLSVGAPLDNPTNVVEPGAAANALQDLNNRSSIQLDDGSNVQNPLPLPPYTGPGNTIRRGDTTSGLRGVMGYGFGAYEVHPTPDTGVVAFSRQNVREAAPDVGGSLQVASFNVLNYFSTIDNAGPICGPNEDQGCRGADTPEEFTRQRDKVINALLDMDADVVGLMEIENNANDEAVDDLIAGLNNIAGADTWAKVDTGSIGTDAIKVAFIYKPAAATPMGPFAILDSSVDARFNDEKNRPMLTQTFKENTYGETVTVAVNHLKSKGSDCDALGDPDTGDGQGNCNLTRTLAAEAIVDWLATDPTGSGDPDFLVIGDLNSYAMEDPIDALETGGYTDLVEAFQGVGALSFVFFGQSGYLDHSLASPSLVPFVTGVDFWHINAEEPRALDYNNFNQPLLYQPNEFRASDHDPVVVGLDLGAPRLAKIALVDDLGALLPTGDAKVDRQIAQAIDRIEDSLSSALWESNYRLNLEDGGRVFDRERQAVQELAKAVAADGVAAADAADAIDVLVEADRFLSEIAIADAVATGGNQRRIDLAMDRYDLGLAQAAAGNYYKAVGEFKKAWTTAMKA